MSTWQAAQSALPGLSPGTSSGTCAHWSFPINRRAGSIMLGSSIAFIDAHRKSVGYRCQLSVPSATRYLRRPGYGIRRRWFWEEMRLMEVTHQPWSWRACRSRTICSTHGLATLYHADVVRILLRHCSVSIDRVRARAYLDWQSRMPLPAAG